MLRRSGKPVVLAVNKVDNFDKFMPDVYEFYNLGIGDPVPVSAASRLGIGDMLDAVIAHFPEHEAEEKEDERPRVAIVGKPNVGKSSIINKLTGKQRVIVSDVAGTTRDAYVEDDYFEALKALSEQAAKSEANLVLMGIEPTYPSEKYGYIIPKNSSAVSDVATFKEKPDAETAEAYIAQGALWNGGVFAYKLRYVLDKAHELIDFTDYKDLFDKYAELNKISFDYAVVEKEPKIQVMRFAGQWKDLGTWNTLTEAMGEPSVGKAMMNDTCTNVHVVNELNVPVLAMGLHDVVISASPEGILVSDKEQSSYIKPYVDKIDQQIMFAEKSWGSFRVLDVEDESLTIKVTLNPGHSMNYHSHMNRDEVWVVISGTGRTVVDGAERPVHVGDVVRMQAGCRHTVLADSELQLIEVQLGKEISVHDKQKFPLEQETTR